jgi:hypothetical protein
VSELLHLLLTGLHWILYGLVLLLNCALFVGFWALVRGLMRDSDLTPLGASLGLGALVAGERAGRLRGPPEVGLGAGGFGAVLAFDGRSAPLPHA